MTREKNLCENSKAESWSVEPFCGPLYRSTRVSRY